MVKFILLGHMRSGSTLLLRAAREHPDIHMFGEIFNRSRKARQKEFSEGIQKCSSAQSYGIGPETYYREGEDGGAFLDRFVFFERHSHPLAVGFKLFYDHARDNPNALKAWEYIAANRDIRIIHLTRENLIGTLVSLRIATQTNEWARPTGDTRPRSVTTGPMHLDPGFCERFCNRMLEYKRWAQDTFREYPMLSIEYENDVCSRFQHTMHRIHDFVEVPRRRAFKLLEKQTRGKLRDRIANYDELKEYFAHTPYARMFE